MIPLVGKLVCTNFERNRNSDHQFLHQLSHLEINEQRSYYIFGQKHSLFADTCLEHVIKLGNEKDV